MSRAFRTGRLRQLAAALLLVLDLAGCRAAASAPMIPISSHNPTAQPAAVETPVQLIPLSDPLDEDDAELSGLGWVQDHLILLPQYPEQMGDQGGAVYSLSRLQLENFLSGQAPGPLDPVAIPFESQGIEDSISGYEGFEAIGFHGSQVFLTIEARGWTGYRGYVAKGTLAEDLSSLKLEPGGWVENPLQAKHFNKSDEALLVDGDRILTFYEMNGLTWNINPHASVFDLALTRLDPLPLPRLEYRLTDASEPDAQGRFWVINSFYPGDFGLFGASDPLAELYGEGPTHAESDVVERLVEFQITDSGIERTQTPPIQLQLDEDGIARNWEGLAWVPGLGFFLASDYLPGTLLGFVPYAP